MFSKADRLQIQQKGLTIELVNQYIDFFKKGIPVLNIAKPAMIGDGILLLNEVETGKYVEKYETHRKNKKIIKFVPASGAATRMFKALYEFISKPNSAIIADDVAQVIHKIQLFAFFQDLKVAIERKGSHLFDLLNDSSYKDIVNYVLSDRGLSYGNLPKGLLKFHSYPDGDRTPLEEHMVEGAMYAKNSDDAVVIHFTVSPEHLPAFTKLASEIKAKYERQFGVKFTLNFSVQKPSTDTIAVDGRNNPFRNQDGSLIFRPGGHGALLDNLNDLDADIIFLKNIDNIVPDRLKEQTVTYKKILAGILLDLQLKVFEYLSELEDNTSREDLIFEIRKFIETYLGYRLPSGFSAMKTEERRQVLIKILNRPIRVCGMVKNTGEPGGGPFWVEQEDGSMSLQILESSQFNLEDEKHRQVFKKATHFNPVDIVISPYNYKGEKFDLKKFRDPNTGFISLKSKDGMELKALELPGLWNGAMADWNTVFVEVPGITFNPVKSINDLLRPEHQNIEV